MAKSLFPIDKLVVAVLAITLGTVGASTILIMRAAEVLEAELPAEEEAPPPDDNCRVDPQLQKDVTEEGKNFLKEINGIIAKAKRVKRTKELATLTTIKNNVAKGMQKIKNPPVRDEEFCFGEYVNEFRELAWWDQLNPIRSCVETPGYLKEFGQAEKAVTRILKTKAKKMTKVGVDPEAIRAKFDEYRTKKAEIERLLNEGSCEEVGPQFEELGESEANPGYIWGGVERYVDLADRATKICNPELKTTFEEIIGPMREAMGQGQFRAVDQMFNDLGDRIWEFIDRTTDCSLWRNSSNVAPTIEKLEALFQKVGGETPKQEP